MAMKIIEDPYLELLWKVLHLNRRWDERFVMEDDVQQKWIQDDTRHKDRNNDVRGVLDKGDFERSREDKVGWIGGDEDCGCDISHGELGEDPRSWMLDVA